MVFFLSAGDTERLSKRLIDSGVPEDTPCAIVYKATWPDEKKVICSLKDLPEKAKEEGITKTALIIVGRAVAQTGYEMSKLYDPGFTTEYRKGKNADA